MPNEELELSIGPEALGYIILKARIFDEKTAAVNSNPGSNASDDGEIEILEDQPDDPTYDELIGALNSLNLDQQLDLVAMVWVGRGDYSADEWDEARREASNVRDQHIPSYLAETPLLSDFLEEAITALGLDLDEYRRDRL
jgi:hypothetical protein